MMLITNNAMAGPAHIQTRFGSLIAGVSTCAIALDSTFMKKKIDMTSAFMFFGERAHAISYAVTWQKHSEIAPSVTIERCYHTLRGETSVPCVQSVAKRPQGDIL